MIAAVARLRMPYPGLRPFDADDQQLFFGREAQVAALLRQLEDHRFVAVVGSSGSGKSSLVRAGLLPAVREGFLLADDDWLTMVIQPGHEPYRRLAREVVAATEPGTTDDDGPRPDVREVDTAAVLDTLRRGDFGLLDALELRGVGKQTMVVVDQFEELFAFRRDNARAEEVASRDEAAAFVKLLLRSCSDAAARVWVVLTMRSDFIGHCEAFLGLPEVISRSQFLVPRLDRRQMHEAIARPGEVTGAAFEPFMFEDGLVNRIINEAGDRPDQLPLMQHALMRTWKLAVGRCHRESRAVELTHVDYERAGRIDDALSRHADAAWEQIRNDPKKANIARQLFLLLCDVSPDGQITRRRPRVSEVEFVTGATVKEIEEVVALFNADDRNFLVLSGPLTSEAFVDISHEALLRQWQLFAAEWLAEERNDVFELRLLTELSSVRFRGLLSAQQLARVLAWRRRVTSAWSRRYVSQEAWERALKFVDDSEREVEKTASRRRRNIWLVGIALACLTLVSLVTTGISLVQKWKADQSAAVAEAHRRTALKFAATAEAEKTKALAFAATAEKEKNNALASAEQARQAKELADKAKADAESASAQATALATSEQEQRIRAENATMSAKVQGYWHPLQFTGVAADRSETNALLRVARSEPRIREQFVTLALSEAALARRFNANPRGVVVAAVGLSPSIRASLLRQLLQETASPDPDIDRAREVLRVFLEGDAVDQLLAEIRAGRDKNQLRALGQKLAALVATAPPPDLAERLLTEIKRSGDADQRQALVQAFAVAAKTSGGRPGAMLDAFRGMINSTPDAATVRLLGQGIAAIAEKLPDSEAPATADQFLADIKSAPRPDQAEALSQALRAVVAKLSGGAATTARERILADLRIGRAESHARALSQGLPATVSTIDGLVAAMKGMKDARTLRGLGTALMEVSGKLADTDPVAALDVLLPHLVSELDDAQSGVLGEAVAAVAIKAPETHRVWSLDGTLAIVTRAVDARRLQVLGDRLTAIIRAVPDKDAKAVAERLLPEIAIRRDPDQLHALGQGLVAAVEKLDPSQAGAVRQRILSDRSAVSASGSGSTLGSTQVAPFARRAALANGWAASFGSLDAIFEAILSTSDSALQASLRQRVAVVANRIGEADAPITVDPLLEQMRAPGDEALLDAYGMALAVVAPKLSGRETPSRFAAVAVAMEGPISDALTRRLSDALVLMAAKLEESGSFGDSEASAAIDAFIGAIKRTTSSDLVRPLGEALAALSGKLTASQADAAIDKLVKALGPPADSDQGRAGEQRPPQEVPAVPSFPTTPGGLRPRGPLTLDQARALGDGLIACVGKLGSAAARQRFERMLEQIKTTPALTGLGPGLAVAAERIAATPAAAAAVDALLVAIKQAEGPNQRQALGQALGKLADNVPESRAVALSERLTAAIKGTVDQEQFRWFAQALPLAAKRVPDGQAGALAQTLIASIKAAQDAAQMNALGLGLAALVARVKPDDILVRDLVEMLKYPSLPHHELLESMRSHLSGMPPATQGLWATTKWLGERKFAGVDLDASPK